MSKYRLFMGYQRIQSATLVPIAKIQCNSPIPSKVTNLILATSVAPQPKHGFAIEVATKRLYAKLCSNKTFG
jgi:hypothetical protein